MRSFTSPVAAMCGLNLRLFFMKAKKGMAQYYRESGGGDLGEQVCTGVIAANPRFLKNNNGIASWLTLDPENGLPEWTITGKCHVVRCVDDGSGPDSISTVPLSVPQVWGIQEMIHCSMDIYDFDPKNMREGWETLKQWANEYRQKTWVPTSGTGGMDVYN